MTIEGKIARKSKEDERGNAWSFTSRTGFSISKPMWIGDVKKLLEDFINVQWY